MRTVQVVGVAHNIQECLPRVWKAAIRLLLREQRLETREDTIQVTRAHGDTLQRNGHIPRPYQPITLRSIGNGAAAICDGLVIPPAPLSVGA